MEIKHENINIVIEKDNCITQKEVRDQQDLIKRLSENLSTTFELKFGQFNKVEIRRDLERYITSFDIIKCGGNKKQVIFANIINAITDKNYKIEVTTIVQKIEDKQEKSKVIFLDKLKSIFWNK